MSNMQPWLKTQEIIYFLKIIKQKGKIPSLYPVRTIWTTFAPLLRDGLILVESAWFPEWRRSRNGGDQGFLACLWCNQYHTIWGRKEYQMPAKPDSDAVVRDIKRQTRKKYNAEEKISIILKDFVLKKA